MLAVATAPSEVVAVAVMMFGPSANGRATEKIPALCGADSPLTVIVAVGSLTVPLMVVGLIFRKLRLAGEGIVNNGAGVKTNVKSTVLGLSSTPMPTS